MFLDSRDTLYLMRRLRACNTDSNIYLGSPVNLVRLPKLIVLAKSSDVIATYITSIKAIGSHTEKLSNAKIDNHLEGKMKGGPGTWGW